MDIAVLLFVLAFVFAILLSCLDKPQYIEQPDQQRTNTAAAIATAAANAAAIAHTTATTNAAAFAHAYAASAAAARANALARIAAITRANANNTNAAAAITDVVLQVPENFQQPETTASTTTTDVVIEVLENPQQKSEEELECLKKECVICLDDIDEAVKANTILLSCGHMFHPVCISQWLKTQKTCPSCRAPV